MKQSSKGAKAAGNKTGQEFARRDRKSSTGMSGSPKKGGYGGKFTWSGDGFSEVELRLSQKEVAVGANGLDFEDPEEEGNRI